MSRLPPAAISDTPVPAVVEPARVRRSRCRLDRQLEPRCASIGRSCFDDRRADSCTAHGPVTELLGLRTGRRLPGESTTVASSWRRGARLQGCVPGCGVPGFTVPGSGLWPVVSAVDRPELAGMRSRVRS